MCPEQNRTKKNKYIVRYSGEFANTSHPTNNNSTPIHKF